MNEKFNKIAKIEQLVKMLGRVVHLIAVHPCIILLSHNYCGVLAEW